MKLQFLGKFSNFGLLIMRVGLGICFLFHGSPKFFGGPEKWIQIGGAMSMVGINFLPTFWGFMSAFAEFAGGVLLILGFYFRPGMLLLVINMAVALKFHVTHGDSFGIYSHALELLLVFIGLLFVGPGKYSIDKN